ncbi:MAG: hypothetical protein PUE01_01535 [Clostridiaceae bacterium]|nr:hypothetical protein [Clostridiaceae bacterium]
MAVRDYREMYVMTILTLVRKNGQESKFNRSYLSKLSFDELKNLAESLQG